MKYSFVLMYKKSKLKEKNAELIEEIKVNN